MLITKQKIPLDFDMNISINNHIISKVDNLKYLGVVLDNKLTWNSHIAQAKKQISQACGETKLEFTCSPVRSFCPS